jgi:hypothetical protein
MGGLALRLRMGRAALSLRMGRLALRLRMGRLALRLRMGRAALRLRMGRAALRPKRLRAATRVPRPTATSAARDSLEQPTLDLRAGRAREVVRPDRARVLLLITSLAVASGTPWDRPLLLSYADARSGRAGQLGTACSSTVANNAFIEELPNKPRLPSVRESRRPCIVT